MKATVSEIYDTIDTAGEVAAKLSAAERHRRAGDITRGICEADASCGSLGTDDSILAPLNY
ncbi:MAG: hypothetical protein ABI583_03845 [Betaproteobacteria bacterium]